MDQRPDERQVLIIYSIKTVSHKEKAACLCDFLRMAQEQGFEPWHPVTGLQAFQACLFNHLSIPASQLLLYYDTITFKKYNTEFF